MSVEKNAHGLIYYSIASGKMLLYTEIQQTVIQWVSRIVWGKVLQIHHVMR